MLISLSGSCTVLAQAIQELGYDNGIQAHWWTWSQSTSEYAVIFSIPPGWRDARLLTARYYLQTAKPGITIFRVHVYAADGSTDLLPSQLIVNPPAGPGWFDVDLRPYLITRSSDFYISIEFLSNQDPLLGQDSNSASWSGYSRDRTSGSQWVDPHANLMIRAVVENNTPVSPAVGGAMSAVNKFAVLAPYVALLGLFGAASVVIVIRRRRKP